MIPRKRWLIVAWVSVIGAVCLAPDRTLTPSLHDFRLCLVCGNEGALAGMVLNAVLYAPLGALLHLATGSVAIAFAGGAALSGMVEAAQLWIPGRFSTLEDLLMNSLGALIGALLALHYRAWLFPSPRASQGLATSFAFLAVLTVLSPTVLLRPSAPSGRLYSQWTPYLPGLERYRGTVMSAVLDDVPIPNGSLGVADAWHERLELKRPLDVQFEVGPRPPRLAPVLRLVTHTSGDYWEEVILVAVDGDDVVVRTRFRADDFRLERPSYRLRGVMAATSPGDTVGISVRSEAEGGHRLIFRDGGRRVEEARGVSPARGWSLLLDQGGMPPHVGVATDFAWLGLLAFPIGWWAPTWPLTLLLTALPLTALALAPISSALIAPPILAYASAVAAAAAGYTVRHTLFERRRTGHLPPRVGDDPC